MKKKNWNAKERQELGIIRQKIVMAGDLHGGFHILKFETWKDFVDTFCPKKYQEQILSELKSADKRRKELYAK